MQCHRLPRGHHHVPPARLAHGGVREEARDERAAQRRAVALGRGREFGGTAALVARQRVQMAHQLGVDVGRSLERAVREEKVGAPPFALARRRRLKPAKHAEQRHVIAVGRRKSGAQRGGPLAVGGRVGEDGVGRRHSDDGRAVVAAPGGGRGQQCTPVGRVDGQAGHAAADGRERAVRGERAEAQEQLHRAQQTGCRGRVDKIKGWHVFHAQGRQLEDDGREVDALNLGRGRRREAAEGGLGVQPKRFAGRFPT